MANPRKFSEKIALHNQKQAEETAAFEKIMREVSDATSRGDEASVPNDRPTINDRPDIRPERVRSDGNRPGASSPARESRGRSIGGGPMRSRQGSRNIDTSPYGSCNVAYLSPPSDSSWRRTSSDSAIHQSLSQNQDNNHLTTHSPLTLSPTVQRKISNAQNMTSHDNNSTQDMRPRSSTGMQRLPAMPMYQHQQHHDSIPIPSINNTGSLPDLTSFQASMYPPLGQDIDQTNINNYSPSPLGTSPISLSPVSAMVNNSTNFGYQIVSNTNNNNNNSNLNNNNLTKQQQQQQQQQNTQNVSSQPFLSVPDSNRYPLFFKGGNSYDNSQQRLPTLDQQNYDNISQLNDSLSSPNQQNSPENIVYGSHSNITQPILSGYRSPSHNRPSPGSSPGLVQMPNNFDSNSSAPCSPVPQNIGSNGQSCEKFPNDGYYINQQFEQFSLVDTDFVNTPTNTSTFTQFDNSTYTTSNLNMENDLNLRNTHSPSANININHNSLNNSYNPPSLNCGSGDSLLSLQTAPQMHLHNTNKYNNVSRIPEIVFTDFSSSAGDLSKDALDTDLELGTMDFVGFQMLDDPNTSMIADPRIEDSFRRDLN